jgi:hypothetical protein
MLTYTIFSKLMPINFNSLYGLFINKLQQIGRGGLPGHKGKGIKVLKNCSYNLWIAPSQ